MIVYPWAVMHMERKKIPWLPYQLYKIKPTLRTSNKVNVTSTPGIALSCKFLKSLCKYDAIGKNPSANEFIDFKQVLGSILTPTLVLESFLTPVHAVQYLSAPTYRVAKDKFIYQELSRYHHA